MDIYLPIAEVSLDIFVLLGLGAAVGFLSGVFGVGGGFLLTPLLIFIGVPPTVAVASSANQLVGASVSGVLAHWRRGNVDFKMGYVLLVGGLGGLVPRGLDLHPAEAAGSDRADDLDLLRAPARDARRADDDRKHPRTVAAASAGSLAAPTAPAYLDARAAAEGALPPIAALHQRAVADRASGLSSAFSAQSSVSAEASSWSRR